jgi:hypothetical protein
VTAGKVSTRLSTDPSALRAPITGSRLGRGPRGAVDGISVNLPVLEQLLASLALQSLLWSAVGGDHPCRGRRRGWYLPQALSGASALAPKGAR